MLCYIEKSKLTTGEQIEIMGFYPTEKLAMANLERMCKEAGATMLRDEADDHDCIWSHYFVQDDFTFNCYVIEGDEEDFIYDLIDELMSTHKGYVLKEWANAVCRMCTGMGIVGSHGEPMVRPASPDYYPHLYDEESPMATLIYE